MREKGGMSIRSCVLSLSRQLRSGAVSTHTDRHGPSLITATSFFMSPWFLFQALLTWYSL